MLDPDPTTRPSASALCRHDALHKERAGKLAAQLRKELNVEKFRTAMLERWVIWHIVYSISRK